MKCNVSLITSSDEDQFESQTIEIQGQGMESSRLQKSQAATKLKIPT